MTNFSVGHLNFELCYSFAGYKVFFEKPLMFTFPLNPASD